MMSGIFLIRMVGALCVLAATTLWGEYQSRTLQYRYRQLHQFRQGLNLLQTEVSYTVSTLPAAFFSIGSKLNSTAVSELFVISGRMMEERDDLDSGEIWREAVAAVFPRTCLTGEDRRIVEQLAVSLGTAHREGQLKQIQLVTEQVTTALEDALEKRNQGEKMWRYLGLAGGMSLVIVFL